MAGLRSLEPSWTPVRRRPYDLRDARVTYESKDDAGHKFWVARYGRYAIRIDVDLAVVSRAAANVEPYLRADGTRIWSLMQLERQLRPEAYQRRRGGYLDRRRIPAADS